MSKIIYNKDGILVEFLYSAKATMIVPDIGEEYYEGGSLRHFHSFVYIDDCCDYILGGDFVFGVFTTHTDGGFGGAIILSKENYAKYTKACIFESKRPDIFRFKENKEIETLLYRFNLMYEGGSTRSTVEYLYNLDGTIRRVRIKSLLGVPEDFIDITEALKENGLWLG